MTQTADAPLAGENDPSLLVRYYREITAAPVVDTAPSNGVFSPAFAFPELDADLRAFLQPATAAYHVLGEYRGVSVRLLDLRRNSATQTTKTFASLLLVARAVEHIRRSGEPLLLFSPSSGNKAVALRDAVDRALRVGLVPADQLRILTLTPEVTTEKLRRSTLCDDPVLLRRNPIAVLVGDAPEAVKRLGAEFVQAYAADRRAVRLWATLQLDNYRQADMVRAFADYEFGAAAEPGLRLLHAHAVSSAFGLLGYQTGLRRLRERGLVVNQPGYLLVQHLATCDMVLHSQFGDFDRGNVPTYHPSGGEWVQDRSAHFPYRTWSPTEVLEETFYTHNPTTATEMSGLIAVHGGSGIAVSLLECTQRYAECRHLLAGTGIVLPDDPRRLREWSLVMALTGVLNGIDRGLVRDVDGVVVHASGTYTCDDYLPVPPSALTPVTSVADLLHAAHDATHDASPGVAHAPRAVDRQRR